MFLDYLIEKEGELSTYYQEKFLLLSDRKVSKQILRIERWVEEAEDYRELVKRLEVKPLDPKTGLKEIILDRIRVLHFWEHGNVIVFLGVFLKKTQETPPRIIEQNNKRIEKYKALKGQKDD